MHRLLEVTALLLALLLLSQGHGAGGQAMRWGPATGCPDFHEYTQLHWQVQLGHVQPRWIVTDDPDGLADRLVNAVSVFLVALLTKRALCILPAHRWSPQAPLEVAYDAPFIDWSCRQDSAAAAGYNVSEPLLAWKDKTDVSLTDTIGSLWGELHHPTSKYYETFIKSNLRERPENNATVWKLWLHRGLTIGMFNNPHHANELWDIGLRPENAFGCIASYLFRPNRDTLWLVPKPTLAIMTNPRIIKIGIQIRCGDANIKKQQYRSADGNAEMPDGDFDRIAKPYFDCAQALERDIGVAMGKEVQVRWYLMTDTIPLRLTALRRYHDKLVTFNLTAIEFYQSVTNIGFQLTVMEHWLLQQANYHIITYTSGLGRTAAFASLRANNVYTINMAGRNPGARSARTGSAGCLLVDHDRLRSVYDVWSGI